MNFIIYMAVLCGADGLRNYEALGIKFFYNYRFVIIQ